MHLLEKIEYLPISIIVSISVQGINLCKPCSKILNLVLLSHEVLLKLKNLVGKLQTISIRNDPCRFSLLLVIVDKKTVNVVFLALDIPDEALFCAIKGNHQKSYKT